MTHAFHDRLEGYDPRQILHDGCPECEGRGKDLRSAFAHMDTETFARAWQRAFDLNASNGNHDVGRESAAEADLLLVIYAIQVNLERRGFPLDGRVPNPHYEPIVGGFGEVADIKDRLLRPDPYQSIEQEHWRRHDEGRS